MKEELVRGAKKITVKGMLLQAKIQDMHIKCQENGCVMWLDVERIGCFQSCFVQLEHWIFKL